MNIFHTLARILLSLLLLLPVLGTLGVFPEPTADMYSPQGWTFFEGLMSTPYMMPLLGITCFITLVAVLLNRTAFAAVFLAPFTVNVLLFHVFLDAAPISASAIPAYILVILNAYFLWESRKKYESLWTSHSSL